MKPPQTYGGRLALGFLSMMAGAWTVHQFYLPSLQIPIEKYYKKDAPPNQQ